MSYERGLLQITTPRCADTDCSEFDNDHKHQVQDSRSGYQTFGANTVYLPHSCDEWVIGDATNVETLIADLQEALIRLNAQTT